MGSKHHFMTGWLAAVGTGALALAGAESAQARTSGYGAYAAMAPVLPRPVETLGLGFIEDFDGYTAGENVHGQGGWKGWGNDPGAGAFVDDAYSTSEPNSIRIAGASDLIHEFSGYTSGVWTVTAQQYIPDDFAGNTYFIFQNRYTDDASVLSWSTQVVFDSVSRTVANYDGAAAPGSLPYVSGQWVELKLVIDLDQDLQTFYYGGQELYSGSWTQMFPDQGVGGVLNIGSIDLYAEESSPVYYDDISIVPGSGGDDFIFADGFEPIPL